MYNEVITLVGTAGSLANEVGDPAGDVNEKEIFAQVRSVGSKRKLEALAAGLKLAWKFILADCYDYDGQEQVRYMGVTYNVIDTYRTEDGTIELTAARY